MPNMCTGARTRPQGAGHCFSKISPKGRTPAPKGGLRALKGGPQPQKGGPQPHSTRVLHPGRAEVPQAPHGWGLPGVRGSRGAPSRGRSRSPPAVPPTSAGAAGRFSLTGRPGRRFQAAEEAQQVGQLHHAPALEDSTEAIAQQRPGQAAPEPGGTGPRTSRSRCHRRPTRARARARARPGARRRRHFVPQRLTAGTSGPWRPGGERAENRGLRLGASQGPWGLPMGSQNHSG